MRGVNAAKRWVSTALGVGLLTATAAGCAAGTSGAGSRSTLYASIGELSSDSTAIVVGTVAGQVSAGDATVSDLSVENTPGNPALGTNAPDSHPVAVGEVVRVRQDAASRPLLEPGRRYVLWLSPTMLPDAAEQYFITGSNAGMYAIDGDRAVRVATDTGDTLPDTIQISG